MDLPDKKKNLKKKSNRHKKQKTNKNFLFFSVKQNSVKVSDTHPKDKFLKKIYILLKTILSHSPGLLQTFFIFTPKKPQFFKLEEHIFYT